MQPVLEDDALLFSLDDLPDHETDDATAEGQPKGSEAQVQIADLESQLQHLQSQFAEYRATVARTLDQRWEDAPTTTVAGPSNTTGAKPSKQDGFDSGYFESYSYNGLYCFMLRKKRH